MRRPMGGRVCRGLGSALSALLLAAPCALAAPGGREQERRKYEEDETRAAFLLVFAKYTEWPESALPAGEPLVIGVMGETPFAGVLEGLGPGALKDRRIVVKRFRTASELQPCHILYFPASEERLLPGLKARLASWSALTVGESSLFLGFGGALQLFNEEGRLRFVVNRAALDLSHLRVEAKAMSLAKQVVNQP